MLADPSSSTSVNTAPNPDTVAGVSSPGTKKLTVVVVLPIGVNSFGGENVPNAVVYVGLMLENLGVAGSELTWN